MIRVFQKQNPNVGSLARKGDVDGLIKAAAHSEFVLGPEGRSTDVGAPIREKALFALRDVAPDRAGHVFTTALGDPSDRVRCAAVVALYERGDAKRLAEGVGRLPATEGNARAMAVRALFELREPGSSGRLADALLDRPDKLPLSEEDAALVPGLVRVEERPEAAGDVVELLVSALGNEREIVTERAKALLVRLGAASIEPLVRELTRGRAPHRAAAVLGEIKDARALQPLVASLSHPDDRVRSQCCFALGELRDLEAVEPLLQATRDPVHEVRVLAAAALDGMGWAAVAVGVGALQRSMVGEALAHEGFPRIVANGGAGSSPDEPGAGDRAGADEPGKAEPNNHGPTSVGSEDDSSSVERIEVVWLGAGGRTGDHEPGKAEPNGHGRSAVGSEGDSSSVERIEVIWEGGVADAA